MSQDGKPSKLPKQNYSMSRNMDEYFLGELGVYSGHQNFDNNILAFESFMKFLPQALFAQTQGYFKNPFNHRDCSIVIPRLYLSRVRSIWQKGIYCITVTNQYEPNIIDKRVISYKMEEKTIIVYDKKTKRNREWFDPWQVMMKCPKCENESLIGFMQNNDFSVDETDCQIICKECTYNSFFGVEIKPALKLMIPLQPRSTNPVWVHIKACPPVKFALEDVELLALASNDGGFVQDISPTEAPPRYMTHDAIENSIERTSHVSHQYYDDTVEMLSEEWEFYAARIFILFHKMVVEKFEIPDENIENKPSRKSMEPA